jgi:excisionase family DNA binding protein
MEVSQKFMRVEEVAAFLGLSAWTVRKWVRSGKLDSVKMGTAVRIPCSAVDALCNGPSAKKAEKVKSDV